MANAKLELLSAVGSIGIKYAIVERSILKLNYSKEDYFKYKLSLEKYQETAGDPFAQPVQVYSNVENGFGIFGGYSVYRDTLFFE